MDDKIKKEEFYLDEELKRMVEISSSLNEIQRKEYFVKQYEDFLKEVNTIELLQRIKSFR